MANSSICSGCFPRRSEFIPVYMIYAALGRLALCCSFNIELNYHLDGDVVICFCGMSQLPVGLADCHWVKPDQTCVNHLSFNCDNILIRVKVALLKSGYDQDAARPAVVS